MPGPSAWDAVVLLQMGGPATLDEIEPFLFELFADRDIIRLPALMRPFQRPLARYVSKRRAPLVRPRYQGMGNGSPLQRITALQAAALEKEMGVPVHVAMRYTKPWAREAVAALQRDHARRVLLLPLFPHYSISTTQSSLNDLARAIRAAALDADVRYVRNWGTHRGYVDLVARLCLETLDQLGKDDEAHLLFSAHGVPERYIAEGDTYQREVEETTALLRARLTGPFASVEQGYQSGLGPVKWLSPDSQKLVLDHGARRTRTLVMSPLGFVSDHIETMYDMDTLFAGIARENGVERFARVPSFNDRPEFARVLADVAADEPAHKLEAL